MSLSHGARGTVWARADDKDRSTGRNVGELPTEPSLRITHLFRRNFRSCCRNRRRNRVPLGRVTSATIALNFRKRKLFQRAREEGLKESRVERPRAATLTPKCTTSRIALTSFPFVLIRFGLRDVRDAGVDGGREKNRRKSKSSDERKRMKIKKNGKRPRKTFTCGVAPRDGNWN